MKKLVPLLLSFIILLAFTSCTKNSSAKESDASHAQLLSVLNSETVFTTENGTELYLKDYVYGSDETTDYYAEPYEYAFVDFDNDSTEELIADISLSHTHYMVFHIVDTSVYGFLFGNRSLQSVKEDGAFLQTGGADVNYFCKMEFNNNSYKIINTAIKDEKDDIYEIAGKESSIDDINEYIKDWNLKKDVEWIKVS